MGDFEKSIREDENYQTRIKMGLYDLELHKKVRGTFRWERVTLPDNLPPVDLNRRPSVSHSSSPPPGRPGHDYSRDSKRGRESTGSDSGHHSSKVSKQSSETNDAIAAKEGGNENIEQLVEKTASVSEGARSSVDPKSKVTIDPGMVTSVQGTPSKMYPSLVSLESHPQSPIISRLGKKN